MPHAAGLHPVLFIPSACRRCQPLVEFLVVISAVAHVKPFGQPSVAGKAAAVVRLVDYLPLHEAEHFRTRPSELRCNVHVECAVRCGGTRFARVRVFGRCHPFFAVHLYFPDGAFWQTGRIQIPVHVVLFGTQYASVEVYGALTVLVRSTHRAELQPPVACAPVLCLSSGYGRPGVLLVVGTHDVVHGRRGTGVW